MAVKVASTSCVPLAHTASSGQPRSAGSIMTLETAPTLHIQAGGIRFGYRRLGPEKGIPLLLLQHFTGTIDDWDPAIVNGLAQTRPVIVFDNAGVGFSDGDTPDTV